MPKVSIKRGVKFDKETPALARMLAQLLLLDYPGEVIITSGSDGRHSANSRHYKGEAIDIRIWNLPDVEGFRVAYEAALGPHFRVLRESDHLHVQVKKGRQYPPKVL